MMDYLKYKQMQMQSGIPLPAEALHMELQRAQLELQRRDALIEEQQKRIFQLEDEVKRCNKQIQDLVVQLSNVKDSKPKNEMNYKPPQSRYWTAEEHERFMEAVKRYGPKDVKAISQFVGTRNPTQVRTHAQKYYLRLERERKRKEDQDNGLPVSNNSSDDLEDDATPPDQSGEHVHVEPKTEGDSHTSNNGNNNSNSERSSAEEKSAAKKRERAASFGRRASLPADFNSGRSAEPAPVVHSTRQQLQAAAPVVAAMKGWSTQDFNLFIEGLLAFPDEKDINRKCKLISERFLPKYVPDEIKQCYALLHNYIKNKEEESATTFLNEAKRMKATDNAHNFGPGYTTTALPADPPLTLRYTLSPAVAVPRPYPTHMGLPYGSPVPMSYPEYASPPFVSPYAAEAAMMARRASYPMDTFSVTKAISSNEYTPGATPTPTASTTEFPAEHLFPAEYPTWSNTENTSATTSTANTNNLSSSSSTAASTNTRNEDISNSTEVPTGSNL